MGSAATTLRARGPLPLKADKLVIYDGVCNLCDHTVKFLVARDPGRVLKFAALQSAAAQPILEQFGLSRDDALASITFVDNGVAYRKSAAAMMIASYLPVPWKWLYGGFAVPGFLRDGVYDCVAKNRYRVFGTLEEGETCMAPTPELLARFLDAEELPYVQAKRRREAAKAEAAAAASGVAAAAAGSSGAAVASPAGGAAATGASSAATSELR